MSAKQNGKRPAYQAQPSNALPEDSSRQGESSSSRSNPPQTPSSPPPVCSDESRENKSNSQPTNFSPQGAVAIFQRGTQRLQQHVAEASQENGAAGVHHQNQVEEEGHRCAPNGHGVINTQTPQPREESGATQAGAAQAAAAQVSSSNQTTPNNFGFPVKPPMPVFQSIGSVLEGAFPRPQQALQAQARPASLQEPSQSSPPPGEQSLPQPSDQRHSSDGPSTHRQGGEGASRPVRSGTPVPQSRLALPQDQPLVGSQPQQQPQPLPRPVSRQGEPIRRRESLPVAARPQQAPQPQLVPTPPAPATDSSAPPVRRCGPCSANYVISRRFNLDAPDPYHVPVPAPVREAAPRETLLQRTVSSVSSIGRRGRVGKSIRHGLPLSGRNSREKLSPRNSSSLELRAMDGARLGEPLQTSRDTQPRSRYSSRARSVSRGATEFSFERHRPHRDFRERSPQRRSPHSIRHGPRMDPLEYFQAEAERSGCAGCRSEVGLERLSEQSSRSSSDSSYFLSTPYSSSEEERKVKKKSKNKKNKKGGKKPSLAKKFFAALGRGILGRERRREPARHDHRRRDERAEAPCRHDPRRREERALRRERDLDSEEEDDRYYGRERRGWRRRRRSEDEEDEYYERRGRGRRRYRDDEDEDGNGRHRHKYCHHHRRLPSRGRSPGPRRERDTNRDGGQRHGHPHGQHRPHCSQKQSGRVEEDDDEELTPEEEELMMHGGVPLETEAAAPRPEPEDRYQGRESTQQIWALIQEMLADSQQTPGGTAPASSEEDRTAPVTTSAPTSSEAVLDESNHGQSSAADTASGENAPGSGIGNTTVAGQSSGAAPRRTGSQRSRFSYQDLSEETRRQREQELGVLTGDSLATYINRDRPQSLRNPENPLQVRQEQQQSGTESPEIGRSNTGSLRRSFPSFSSRNNSTRRRRPSTAESG